MIELDHALTTATRLREAIAAEIESARGERALLRALDTDGLFDRATRRASFLAETARLERSLSAALAAVGLRLGLQPVSPERLRRRVGDEGAALADALSEVRALAEALQEVDRLNLELARRALRIVRGYVEALRPSPRAYDRFGGRAETPSLALVSSKG